MGLSRKYQKTQKNDRNFTKKYIYTLLTLFLKNKKYFQYYKQLDYLAFRGIFFPAIFTVAKCVRTQCMKKGYFDFQKGFFRPIKGLAKKKFFLHQNIVYVSAYQILYSYNEKKCVLKKFLGGGKKGLFFPPQNSPNRALLY